MANDIELQINFNLSDGTTQSATAIIPGGKDGQDGGGTSGDKVQNTAARGEEMVIFFKGEYTAPTPGTGPTIQGIMLDGNKQYDFLTFRPAVVLRVPFVQDVGELGNTFALVYTDGNVEGNQNVAATQLVLTEAKARFLLNAMNSDNVTLRARPYAYAVTPQNYVESRKDIEAVYYSKGGAEKSTRTWHDYTLQIRKLANDSLEFSGSLFPFSDGGFTEFYPLEELATSSGLRYFVGLHVTVENNVTNTQTSY